MHRQHLVLVILRAAIERLGNRCGIETDIGAGGEPEPREANGIGTSSDEIERDEGHADVAHDLPDHMIAGRVEATSDWWRRLTCPTVTQFTFRVRKTCKSFIGCQARLHFENKKDGGSHGERFD